MRDRPRCLIVEDQALIALAIEGCLEDFGYEAVGPFRSGSDALVWLNTHTPQAVILDYSLVDGDCTGLAQELLRRRIPFLVYSGHARSADTPSEFKDSPWIEKPCRSEEIIAAVRLMIQPRHPQEPSWGTSDKLSRNTRRRFQPSN